MINKTPIYTFGSKKTQLISMIHVGSTVALQNTAYNKLLDVQTYSTKDLEVLKNIRLELYKLHAKVIAKYAIPYIEQCKSSVFLLEEQETTKLEKQIKSLPFVKTLINRAVKEADIYIKNGISIISVENFGAPYFMGNQVSFEELLILDIVVKTLRAKFPNAPMGVHVLSSDELESLPIAIAAKACFIRSEATIFSGFRPEGRTENKGTLAKLFYLRNFFQATLAGENPEGRLYYSIWSDLQKKHTVFDQELSDLSVWLNNLMFMKLEGIILTGAETGVDVAEKDLQMGRKAIEKLKEKSKQYFGKSIEIPLITGSGMNMDMYKKYADFIITGTQLKQNKYWENEVSEENVKTLVKNFS